MQTHQPGIFLHGFSDSVPECRVQRCVFIPFRRGTVYLASGVFEFKRRTYLCGIENGKIRDVAEKCIRFVNVKVARVDLVETEPAVHVRQGCYTRDDPARRQGCGSVLDCAVVGVVDYELVLMSVAEEDVGDDVRGVAVYDLVEEVGRVGERVGAVPSARDMADDPDAFVVVFGFLEFGYQPGEDARVVRVGGIDEVEVVALVPEIYCCVNILRT